ncbi:carbohydrate ABC transporter permease [Lentilactobacillus hilgardii]|uniref:carbohydrate ABC transporter permease n=1 Tax=Lentilactobacillus hilgardii TaxID=1588 RepID=UPI0021A69394|nr:carbohydrate ABC transporter permease [Lentilactobacillus hilgardii]MCT3397063.1 carbohydrate ABC transporter permease [Lentilactobacillus hilgardii]MCT3398657.1 carbohydrate ABC transporter permease [Lentilactobacillus hilgardii]
MKRTSKILFGLFFGVVTIFWFYPFIIVFINALKGKKGIFQNPLWFTRDFTFTNFKTAYQALDFTNSFFNSLVITVASVITITCVSAAAAYALSRVKGPFSSIFYYLCAGTMLIPFQSIMIPLLSLFGKINFLNRTSLIIMNTGLSISLSIILFYGAFQGVSNSLDEAAALDGAYPIKTFIYIIFPSVSPMTGTVIILNAMKIWNDYLLPSLVINKDGMYTIPLKMYSFFGETNSQWQLALAGLVLSMIPIIILFLLLQKQVMASVTEGSVK